MSEKIMYWMAVGFSVIALLLLVTNTALINGNRTLQTEIAARQNSINAAVNLTQLNQNLAQSLANLAVTKNDKDIRDLLSAQGISVRKDAKSDG
ncbi:MAG: hypothetical protein PHX43_09590, partial [Alphaproteobacteria bacterium]|nr:hypothetical protein [Alphaproteobacteria bacterium]